MDDQIQPPEVKRGVSRHEIAAWILMAAGLLLVLKLHLLPALLAGLLVYELVHVAVLKLRHRLSNERAGMVAVMALAILVIVGVAAAVMGLLALVRTEGHLASLLEKLADSGSLARANLPSALSEGLPANADALKDATVDWLRLHAKEIRTVGADFVRTLVHILVGLVIGVMVSLTDVRPHKVERPLAHALVERMSRLGDVFRRIIFAQVRISAINTFLTATGKLEWKFNANTKNYGARPPNYSPQKKQGAVILATGGDGSNGGTGTWFEGAITKGLPPDATDDAVQANIVAAGYGK